MSLKVEQCLHGYGDGHERLAASIALPDAEAYRLDRMSDLSGYPGKHDPPPYLTGYPCGRWYVIARTWIDPKGERRGTVFTHSILVPQSDVGSIPDLRSLNQLFRQPTHPVNRRFWEATLMLTPSPVPLVVDAVAASAWFEAETPLVWTGADPEGAVRAVWTSLPAGERGDFRFCTHALLPRYLDDRLFDWMAAPRQVLLDYGNARQQLRERDQSYNLPGWLLSVAWPPDWRAIDSALPGLGRGDRRAALRYTSLLAQGGRDALLGAADLLARLRVPPGSDTATALIRALIDSTRDQSLASLQDLLSREPLRWAPELEEPLCARVHASVVSLARSLDDAQIDSILAYGGSPGRSAREALRQSAAGWTDEQILARLGKHSELFGDWIFRLPAKRRRALAEGASGDVRALLIGDLCALGRLIEPGDPAWVDVALATPGAYSDERELRRVLQRVGFQAVIEWARGRGELPRVVLDMLADDEALTHVLASEDPVLLEFVLDRVEDDELRERLRLEPSVAGSAWRTLAETREPAVWRSRIARALLETGQASLLIALLANEPDSLATIRSRDIGIVVGAVLRAAFQRTPDANAAALVHHPAVILGVERVTRRDIEWIKAEADVTAAVAWVAGNPSITRRDPSLVLDLVCAWAQRGWPSDVTAGLADVLDALPDERRLSAAVYLLEGCLRRLRHEDVRLVAATFPVVHGALLADKTVLDGLRELFTDHWDKAKRPRQALLRAWEAVGWPPSLLYDAFPSSDAWKHLVRDLPEELSPKGLARFLDWLRREDPSRFRDLPKSVRAAASVRDG